MKMTEAEQDGMGEFNVVIREGYKFIIENGVWKGVPEWLKKKKRFVWSMDIECGNTIVQVTIDPTKHKMTPVDD